MPHAMAQQAWNAIYVWQISLNLVILTINLKIR